MKRVFWFLLLMGCVSLSCTNISLPGAFTPTVLEPTIMPDLATPTRWQDVISPGLFCPTDDYQVALYYDRALAAFREDDYDTAEQYFLSALELDSGFCDAMTGMGDILSWQGDKAGAIDWYERAVAVNPEDSFACINLAYAYYDTGRVEDAIAQFETIIASLPDNPEGYYGLGMIYFESGQFERSIPYLETAAELYEESDLPEQYQADTDYLLGAAHFQLGDCLTAVGYIEPLYPVYSYYAQDSGVNYILGYCYYSEPSMRNLDMAKQYLQRADALGYPLPQELEEFIQ